MTMFPIFRCSSFEMWNPIQWLVYVTGLKGYARPASILAVGFAFGTYWDRHDCSRMIIFRDKSALYGRELKPNEPPSWPSRDQWWN